MVSSDGLANDLTDVNNDKFVSDCLTVSAVVLVDSVGNDHPDQFRAAEEVLGHLTHHCVGHEDVDVLGPADPDQLGDGVEESEASVGQVVYQDDLQY